MSAHGVDAVLGLIAATKRCIEIHRQQTEALFTLAGLVEQLMDEFKLRPQMPADRDPKHTIVHD